MSNLSFDPEEIRNSPVFHGSNQANVHEFLRAPILHVGTQDQANQIVDPTNSYIESTGRKWPVNERGESTRRFPGVHRLQFSQFAEFHPEVFSDEAVNTAHEEFLHKRRIEPTSSVSATAYASKYSPEVQKVLKAWDENKIVAYRNTWEHPKDKYGTTMDEKDVHPHALLSFAVPAPVMNLRRAGRRRDPMTQPVLPMDYSMINPSEITKRQKREYEGE